MNAQLELPLAPRRAPPRQQPAIDRLRAVLTRQGIDWRFYSRGGSVLLRPHLAARSGYEPMCGFYSCGNLTFERTAYCDRPPLTREEQAECSRWREQVWRAAHHELWGRP